jgi:TetR/AcrR family transcriptional repressor of nem operon
LAQVSIDDVCRAAGVHKGSLYHFFPSKEALAAAVLERNWTMMQAVLEEAFASDVPPLARVDRFVDAFSRMLTLMREKMGTTPGCPLGGLAGELAGHGDAPREHVARILHAWARYFAEAVSEAKGRGEVPPEVEPTVAADRLLAHLQGLAFLAKVHDDPTLVLRARSELPMLLQAR